MKKILKAMHNHKPVVFTAIVAIATLLMATLFPLHMELSPTGNDVIQVGQGTFRITIGNQVNAQAADYTCDGLNDDVTFQQAMNALPSIGGQLFILAGQYAFNQTVTRAIDNVSIVGVGAAVSIENNGSTALFSAGGDNWFFCNFQVDAGNITVSGTDDYLWINIWVDGDQYQMLPSPAADMSAVEAAIAALESDVSTLQSDMSTVQSDISTLQSTVSGHTSDISTLESDVSTLQSDVSTLQSDMSTAQSDISTLQSDMSTAQGDISTLEGQMSSALSDISTLQSTVSGHTSDISTLQGQMSGALSDISTLQGQMSTAQSDITDLQSRMTYAEGNITALQSDVSALDVRLTYAEGNITAMQGDISTLQSDVSTLQSDMSTAQSDISTLQSDVSTLQSDVSTLQSTVSGLVSDVATLQSDMSTAQSDISTLQGASHTQGTDTTMGTLTADIDFAGYKAVAMACDNGATLPGTPSTGQWFLHTPTGRKVLMQYDGSDWQPICAFGTMTMYVDSAGSGDHGDDPDLGYSSTYTFDTVQYAIDMIPPLFSEQVEIYIDAAGTSHDYDETVTIRGKNPTGPYSIRIEGNLESQADATADSKTTGSGANEGTLTDTGAFGSYDDMLVYISGADEWSLIDSDTSDVITICGTFDDDTNLEYEIYDWGTSINVLNVYSELASVYIWNLDIDAGGSTTAYGTTIADGSRVQFNNCHIVGRQGCFSAAVATTYQTYFTSSSSGADYGTIYCQNYGTFNLYRSKVCNTGGGNCILSTRGAFVYFRSGSVMDGESGATDAYGIRVQYNAVGRLFSTSAAVYAFIRNVDYGIYAEYGGQAVDCANAQISGVGTSAAAHDATSYGYEDYP